jgi:hypothetical protein
MVFLFAFYLEQHPIACPLKFRIKGFFSLSYCPLISLKHARSCYHRTCRIAWHLMEFKVLPPVSGVTQTIPNTVVQNPNMQSIPGVSQRTQWKIQ